MKAFLVRVAIGISIGCTCGILILTGCAEHPAPHHKYHGKHHKSSGAQVKKTEQKVESKAVDLEWVERYDAMLKINGDKLNPPKKPGDREGITTMPGNYDQVNSKVVEDYNTLSKMTPKPQ